MLPVGQPEDDQRHDQGSADHDEERGGRYSDPVWTRIGRADRRGIRRACERRASIGEGIPKRLQRIRADLEIGRVEKLDEACDLDLMHGRGLDSS